MPTQSNLSSLGTGELPVVAQNSLLNPNTQALTDGPQLVERGRDYYDKGQFSEAATVWQQAASVFITQGDELQAARVLSYLSLALQQQGKWKEADEAIADSLNRLQTEQSSGNSKERSLISAQALNTQGHLQLALGKAEEALKTWQQATSYYTVLGDETGKIGSLINQAQAYSALGFLREALKTLTQAYISLENQPELSLKFTATRNLGDLLRVAGNSNNLDPSWLTLQKSLGLENLKPLEQSEQVLQQSLKIAQQLQSPEAIAEALFSLGNWARDSYHAQRSLYERTKAKERQLQPALGEAEKALDFYRQVIAIIELPTTKIQAQLNQLSLLLEVEQWLLKIEQWSDSEAWWLEKIQPQLTDLPKIQALIVSLPPSLTAVNAQINLAKSQIRLKQIQVKITQHSSLIPQISNLSLWSELDDLIHTTIQQTQTFTQQAKDLESKRTEAYALGILGQMYEQLKDLPQAQEVTDKAIQISQSIQAWDIAYQWQWQLGRIRKAQGKIEGNSGAIAAYNAAVTSLQTIRQNLAALNPDVQFSFRDDVEPVYREFIDLLLQSEKPSQGNLRRAREVLASLQLAELENFLQEACSPAQPELIDNVVDQHDPTAAVIYAIILENRLEVILKLPQNPELQHHAEAVTQRKVEETVDKLQEKLLFSERLDKYIKETQNSSKPIYSWLIEPFESQLKESGIKTLVFVLDGALQNIPMAVLWDGNKYLVEDYAIALSREPQLLEPLALSKERLKILAFGLSQSRPGFSALPNVEDELKEIPAEVTLLNKKFTSTALQKEINARPFSIVHLATHGKFSSDPEETFIVTWDKKIKVNELSEVLESRKPSLPTPIELLVLSACETAAGDNRATLGLAGISVRAGTRSTLATLWSVNDVSTRGFISELYKELIAPESTLTKAEAIQKIQKKFLESRDYKHPYHWAPFVLVGNWLSLSQG
jgi:CHAT domain-containing protein